MLDPAKRRRLRRVERIIRWSPLVHLGAIALAGVVTVSTSGPIRALLAAHYGTVEDHTRQYLTSYVGAYLRALITRPLATIPVVALLTLAAVRAVRFRRSPPPGDDATSIGRPLTTAPPTPRPTARAHGLQQIAVPVVLALLWMEYRVLAGIDRSAMVMGSSMYFPLDHAADALAAQLVYGGVVTVAALAVLAIPGRHWRHARGLGWLLILPVTGAAATAISLLHAALWIGW